MSGGRRRFAGLALTVGVVVVVIAAGAVAVRPVDGFPLDPRGTGPEGLAAVLDLLREFQVDVAITSVLPRDTTTRVFVPVDLLTQPRREALLEWVEDGGTLVVAGATAGLHALEATGGSFADVFGTSTAAPDCDLAGLTTVGEVRHAGWVGLHPPPTEDATTCFPTGDGDAAWLVVVPRGAGLVVALGSAEPLTNRLLGEADNAVLAAALLGPAAGDRLVVVPRPAVGEGDAALADLVPDGVWRGLFLVLAAVVLGVLWRARRLGPPVAERLPPVLPSAELTHSVANLLQRAGDRTSAAARLRADARALTARVLGVPSETSPVQLAALLTARTGLAADDAQLAMLDAPVRDDHALVRVAEAAAALRRAVTADAAVGEPRSES